MNYSNMYCAICIKKITPEEYEECCEDCDYVICEKCYTYLYDNELLYKFMIWNPYFCLCIECDKKRG